MNEELAKGDGFIRLDRDGRLVYPEEFDAIVAEDKKLVAVFDEWRISITKNSH